MKKSNQALSSNNHLLDGLYQLNIADYWKAFKSEPLCVWATCFYIFNEFLRAQDIFPVLSGLPIHFGLIFLGLIAWMTNKKEKFVKDKFILLLIAFLLIIIISSIFAYDSSYSFERIEYFVSWLIIYFLIVQNIKTEIRLLLFTAFLFLPIFKMSLHGAKTWAGNGFAFDRFGITGPEGFFANSGELSLLMVMFFAMSLGFYIGIQKHLGRIKRLIFLLLPLTSIMTVLASATRGSQLALLIQILIFGVLYKKFNIKGILLTILLLCLAYNYLPEEQKKRFESAGTDQTSVARLTYWSKGFEMLQDHPFTGVGYFNFSRYFDFKYSNYKIFDRLERAHSHIVEIASTLGYPGIIVYLLIIYGCYHTSIKIRKLLQDNNLKEHWIYSFTIGMDCALIGYFIGALFMSVAFYPYIWIHAAYIVATFISTKNIVQLQQEQNIQVT